MVDEMKDLLEELDALQGRPVKRSLTAQEDLAKITSLGSYLTDLDMLDLFSTARELETHLDSMLTSIHDYRDYLSRTRNRF